MQLESKGEGQITEIQREERRTHAKRLNQYFLLQINHVKGIFCKHELMEWKEVWQTSLSERKWEIVCVYRSSKHCFSGRIFHIGRATVNIDLHNLLALSGNIGTQIISVKWHVTSWGPMYGKCEQQTMANMCDRQETVGWDETGWDSPFIIFFFWLSGNMSKENNSWQLVKWGCWLKNGSVSIYQQVSLHHIWSPYIFPFAKHFSLC